MNASLLDPDSIRLVREFIKVYGQAAYEGLCDRFAGQPDEHLISTLKKALYGTQSETDPRSD
jgi:hypothetical protein